MAAYPGEGNKMSNYGLKVPTPEELKLLWGEIVGVSWIYKIHYSANIADNKDKGSDGCDVRRTIETATYFTNLMRQINPKQ